MNSRGDELVRVVGTEVERRSGVRNTDNTLYRIVESARLRLATAGKDMGTVAEKALHSEEDTSFGHLPR